MARCRCKNLDHGHGPKCQREAAGSNQVCDDYRRKEARELPTPPPLQQPQVDHG